MSREWPAGIIRKTPITPTGPYQDGTAPGVWTLDQMNYWLKQNLWPIAGNNFERGLFAGGDNAGYSNVISYITITTTGNSIDFGDLTAPKSNSAGCGSKTTGIFAGGFRYTAGSTYFNVIEFSTFSTLANATDFGDLTVGREKLGSANSNTRGVFIGGQDVSAGSVNVIDYITIASAGNAIDFGDMQTSSFFVAASSSPTRVVFIYSADVGNNIQYLTTATTGNSTNFGTLSQRFYGAASCSSSTRALFAGSVFDVANTINYVTIATTGNGVDFGDLYTGMYYLAACSSSIRGVFGGGQGGSSSNVLQYTTIATAGNTADFGDLIVGDRNLAACSSSNGGVQ